VEVTAQVTMSPINSCLVAADRGDPDAVPRYATPSATNGSTMLNSEEPHNDARLRLASVIPLRENADPEVIARLARGSGEEGEPT